MKSQPPTSARPAADRTRRAEPPPEGTSRGRRRPPAEPRQDTPRRAPRRRRKAAVALLLVTQLAAAFSFVGCKREERVFRVPPAAAARAEGVRVSELQPGPATPDTPLKNHYDENAFAQSEGQRLYNAFNCVGCHAHGGGNIGPPLMDEKWRYGSNPDQIFLTIMEGRPNGMPAYRGKLNDHQAWELVAYVRSLSGLTPRDAAPARSDHMKSSPPGNSVDPLKPQPAAEPQPGD